MSMSIVLFLFTLVLLFFFETMTSSPAMGSSRSKILEYEATRLSDSVLLPGFPSNWNGTNVQKIGLTSNDVLNLTKINNLTNMDYDLSKIRLGIQYDYFLNISYVNATNEKVTMLKNKTSLEDILNNRNFVVSRQRSSIIKEGNSTFPAKILILSYTN